ncbi:hypothetical protein C8J56DRAFT_818170 [Mycena floridula]|nr:hypothetical protein C8J56DRAFT_818170 [Mycena floridula]
MIGSSKLEYCFIRLSIFALRLVAPVSLVYLAACAVYPPLLSPWITILALSEGCFYLFVYFPRSRRFQKVLRATDSPPLTRSEREALFLKCANCIPDSTYPLGWFLSPEVNRDNVKEWLMWALFSSLPEDASVQWDEEIEEYVQKLEKMLGKSFEPGRNAKVQSMRIHFDRVRMNHRPLIWYSIVGLVDIGTAIALTYLGFRHYTPAEWFRAFPLRPFAIFSQESPTEHFPFWFRPHKSSTKTPIVFIHGIGIGLYPYVALISELVAADPDVGILLIELLPISMHMTSKPLPGRGQLLEAISTTMSFLDISQATLAAHSYGTVIAAHILRSYSTDLVLPEGPPRLPMTDNPPCKFNSILLIDPIPILLHLPDVAYNFLYRSPKKANQWQLWYFASRDPDVARTLGRHFFWQNCIVWREDLLGNDGQDVWTGKTAVVLSGSDQIVNSSEVWKYLTGTTSESQDDVEFWTSPGGRLQVVMNPGLDHATVFDTKERRKNLVDILDRFTRSI